ncbi:MAG: 3-hydroxybutyryl-CoA dehydrogenase [Armatimonadetes bacterium]|nr:3-hydroxybutyryl-CoA dehydrogenase [Armatimonadota bacterium]
MPKQTTGGESLAKISRVGVVGAGTMGNGIAQVFAQSGFPVVLQDRTMEMAQGGFSRIEKNLARGVEKGKVTEEEKTATLSRIQCTAMLSDLADCDLVVEAVYEDPAVKKQVFPELDRLTKGHTVLASNTSAISITELAAATKRPGKVLGMHFMNPVPLMKLVEIIRGLETADTAVVAILDLCRKLGKVPVEAQDFPGFISNRILMPMINEAIYALMEGVGTREGIDTVMKLGMNHPMGPLELADFIGLDVCLAIMEVLYEGFCDTKYRPCPLLRKLVKAGHLGKKTGRGFYSY